MDIFFIPWVIIITIITYFVTKIVWDLAIGNPFNVNPVFFNNILIIPGLGRPHGEGNGKWLQNSCLENSMDRGAWWATVHGVAKRHDWVTNTHKHTHTLFLSTFSSTAKSSVFIYIFTAPALKSASSPRSPNFFHWEMVLRNQDPETSLLIATVIISSPLQRMKLGNIHLYAHTHTYTPISIFISISKHPCI